MILEGSNPYQPASLDNSVRPPTSGRLISNIVIVLLAGTSLVSLLEAFSLLLASLLPGGTRASLIFLGLRPFFVLILIVLIPVWTYQFSKALARFIPREADWKPGFAAGVYFIPIANLLLPPRVMREILNAYRAMKERGAVLAGDLHIPISRTSYWWGCYIGASLVAIPRRFLPPDTQPFLEALSALLVAGAGWFLLRLIAEMRDLRSYLPPAPG